MLPYRCIHKSSKDGKWLLTGAVSVQPPSANGTENWAFEISSLLYPPGLNGHGLV